MKTAERMTADEFARSIGVDSVERGFSSDVSPMQLTRMTTQQLSDRRGERAEKQKAYTDATRKWEAYVWDRYTSGKFGSHEIFDTDAFYVISELVPSNGVDMLSPFRISMLSEYERRAYLKTIDHKILTIDTRAAIPYDGGVFIDNHNGG